MDSPRMGRRQRRLLVSAGVLALALAAAGSAAAASAHDRFDDRDDVRGDASRAAVYTETNAAAGNRVVAFARNGDGVLAEVGSFPTGGTGTGAGLGSQGAVTLSDDGRVLLAVNAGSDTVSTFIVRRSGLVLADVEPSRGDRPIGVTIDRDVVYVLNAGAPASVVGFRLGRSGDLVPLPGASGALSDADVGPAQAELSPDGRSLVVTEKATNLIDVFPVGRDGVLGTRVTVASSGQTPFGFAFDRRGRAIVSEAFGGTASALSSYAVSAAGLTTISGSVVAGAEKAACWVVVTDDGRFAYTTNTATGSVSGYAIGRDGSLSLLQSSGIAATTGGSPIDAALGRDDRVLYVLNGTLARIDGFRVRRDGSLEPLSAASVGGLPAGSVGLAAR